MFHINGLGEKGHSLWEAGDEEAVFRRLAELCSRWVPDMQLMKSSILDSLSFIQHHKPPKLYSHHKQIVPLLTFSADLPSRFQTPGSEKSTQDGEMGACQQFE